MPSLFSAFASPQEDFPRRLLAVQGPTQLVTGLCALRHETAALGFSPEKFRDTLVIGGLYADPEPSRGMERICRQIADIWPFHKIVCVQDIEHRHHRGEASFADYAAGVARTVGEGPFESVWVCRNMQPFNEAVLRAAPEARKVCYGDGYGMIDLDGREWMRPVSPEGYIPADEILTVIPVAHRPGIFERLPLRTVPLEELEAILRQAARAVAKLQDVAQALAPLATEPFTLACLSNLTESRDVPGPEAETAFYMEALGPHLRIGETIVLKSHPRECCGQTAMLADALRREGHVVHVPQGLAFVPVELLFPLLRVGRMISLMSSAVVGCSLLSPATEVVIGVAPDVLGRHIAAFASGICNSFRLYKTLSETIRAHETFSPLCLTDVPNDDVPPRPPFVLPGIDA